MTLIPSEDQLQPQPAPEHEEESPWVDDPAYPGLLRCYDPTALKRLMLCKRLHYYKQVRGLQRKPFMRQKRGSIAPPGFSPHLQFGTWWHKCVETFDRLRLKGVDPDEATDAVVQLALELTWIPEPADGDFHREGKPWGGEVVKEWQCTGVEHNVTKTGQTRRKFLCDAARDWWIYDPRHGGNKSCPKCRRPVDERTRYLPYANKNRLNLLRAVLSYCDDQREGGLDPAKLEDGTPALELRFDLDLPVRCPDGRSYVLCGHVDRFSEFHGHGGDGLFPHERKTTSLALGRGYWNGFRPNPQVDTYDWAAHRLYLKHEGVIVEAVQVMKDGVKLARSVMYCGPECREEWEEDVCRIVKEAEECARQAPSIGERAWPRNTMSCNFASGGMPCEFRDLCAAAPSERERIIEHDYEITDLWNPMHERDD